jgi:geranylgeranyl diphosphate synthase type II
MLSVEKLREIVEKNIAELDLKTKSPAELYNPVLYTLGSKGKRIRPVMALLACQMFSENIDNAILPAIGLEVFHNFTLLHDDIMDNAPVRRGLPTVHNKWNTNTAILSGDAMMIEANKLIGKAPDCCLRSVNNVFNDIALGVCEGQMYDMQFETRTNVSESEYIEMITLKTSVLLAGSLKIGALIGGATPEQADILYNAGLNTGIAFQLIDDWLDVYSNPEIFGKKTGGDIVENKKTYLLIKALELSKNRTELLQWIEKKNFHESEKIASVTKIYDDAEIGKLTLQKASEYSKKAFDYIDKLNIEKAKKQNLTELIDNLLKREK